MQKRRGFTLIELLVVIAIIALLMGILMPALTKVKEQAKAVACQARIKEWGLIFAMYTNDNNGYFHNRPLGSNYELMWPQFYREYYSDPMMRCCPTAQNPDRNNAPFGTWGWKDIPDSSWGWGGSWDPAEGIFGSYGFSRYMLNNRTLADNWKGPAGVRGGDKVPVFLDCLYVAISPSEEDAPLPDEDAKPVSGDHMQNSCVNRHSGFLNGLFLDWSVRKIGLKELWTLKWHRSWDRDDSGNYDPGPWTTAGGVQSNSWPEWMRGFQDY